MNRTEDERAADGPPQSTPSEAEGLYNALHERKWDEVRTIIQAQPDLVNEKYICMPLLQWIVQKTGAPDEIVSECFERATKEVVDELALGSRQYILHYLAEYGHTKALSRALKVSDRHVNSQPEDHTPLHLLLGGDHTFRVHRDATEVLLDYGADSSIKKVRSGLWQQDGQTPVDEYKQNKCEKYNDTDKEEQKEQLLELLQNRKMIPVEIRARGPEALKAFNEARKEGETVVNKGRSVFMGLERVGKTSTINSFLRNQPNQQEDITDTIVTTKVCIKARDELNWELACDNRQLSSGDTSRQVNSQTPLLEGVPENNASTVEESTREATSDFIMNIWDFGGQPIYHTIQQIFCVSFGVACVVFNLENDLDAAAKFRDPTTGEMYEHQMTNLQFILYCIRSVFMNSRNSTSGGGQLSPHVGLLLIGTHLDSLEGNENGKKDKAGEIFIKIQQAMKGKPYKEMVFFYYIENNLPFDRSYASKIMDQILKFAKKMVSSLPSKWLFVQQEIQKLKEEHIYLQTEKVFALVGQWGVQQDTQRRVLLEYLHDIGEILYFPGVDALKDIIVLDLIRMFDMFTTIINVIIPEPKESRLKEAWRKLDSGILEEHLFRHLLNKFNITDDFDFFVSLMQKFGLVCERKTQEGECIFYVLSRLKPKREVSPPAEDYGKRAVSIFHEVGDYLPDDLFQHGVTKFIEKFLEDSQPKLSYEHVELDIDEFHHVVLDVANTKYRRMFQTTIIRRKTSLTTGRPTKEAEPSLCKEVLSFLEEDLNIFCESSAQGVELRSFIPRVCCPNAHMHILRKFDRPEDVLPSGSNGMEVERYRQLFGDNGPRQLDRFNDDDLQLICDNLNSGWTGLSVQLGLSPTNVNDIYHSSIKEDLVSWRDEQSTDQIPNMILALRKQGLDSLAEAVCKRRGYTGFVDDTIIATVSKELEKDRSLRRFGVRLGLGWSEVNRFNDRKTHTRKTGENMMKHWRNIIVGSQQDKLKILCTALRQHERNSLAYKLFSGDIGDQKQMIKRTKQEYFDDEDLLFICDNFESSWQRLGKRLGLKQTEINAIAQNNGLDKDYIMDVLVTWRDGQPTNQIPIMMKALRHHESLVKRLCDRHGYRECEAPLDKPFHVIQICLVVSAILSFVLFVLAFVPSGGAMISPTEGPNSTTGAPCPTLAPPEETRLQTTSKVIAVILSLVIMVTVIIPACRNNKAKHNDRPPMYTRQTQQSREE